MLARVNRWARLEKVEAGVKMEKEGEEERGNLRRIKSWILSIFDVD